IEAIKNGARGSTMCEVTEDCLCTGGILADYEECDRMGRKLGAVIAEGRTIRMTSSAGTDLRGEITGWCGINVIFNYADEIFTQAGYGINDMLFNIVATGSINLVFTFVGMVVIDRWGRRKLMLLGFGGLSIIYLIFGMFYQLELKGMIMLVSVLTGIALYAMTLAPTTWVVLSEIFPNKVRGVAMSIATMALWSACFAITYAFPVLNKWVGASGTFWTFGVICVGGFVFIKKYLPETKGKSLEEIESEIIK
ncbi:MAG: sugar porter family MFS transporter, partial [Bacteroidetes bacterium]|nr:sugar porter family MFS transporter [Bacteroidota bacterium]